MAVIESKVGKILSKIYYNLSDKAALSGLDQLKKEIKQRQLDINENEIEKWLKNRRRTLYTNKENSVSEVKI